MAELEKTSGCAVKIDHMPHSRPCIPRTSPLLEELKDVDVSAIAN
jgi:hypothetical protein